VLQDTILFGGTIRDNIAYGRLDATPEEIIEAAKMANAHDFISAMPHGYDSTVGERDSRFPAVNASASASPAPWSATRRFSFSTNRLPRSTPNRRKS
jgi:hypothetical protein